MQATKKMHVKALLLPQLGRKQIGRWWQLRKALIGLALDCVTNLLFFSASLVAIGVAIILMEDMVRAGQMSSHSCPPELICDYSHTGPARMGNSSQLSIGIFAVIVGAVLLGFGKASRKPNTPKLNQKSC